MERFKPIGRGNFIDTETGRVGVPNQINVGSAVNIEDPSFWLHIEKGIQAPIKALLDKGFRPITSCEGHWENPRSMRKLTLLFPTLTQIEKAIELFKPHVFRVMNNNTFSSNREKEQNLANGIWGECDKWFFLSVYLSNHYDPKTNLKRHIESTNQKTDHFTEFIINLSNEICESLNRR